MTKSARQTGVEHQQEQTIRLPPIGTPVMAWDIEDVVWRSAKVVEQDNENRRVTVKYDGDGFNSICVMSRIRPIDDFELNPTADRSRPPAGYALDAATVAAVDRDRTESRKKGKFTGLTSEEKRLISYGLSTIKHWWCMPHETREEDRAQAKVVELVERGALLLFKD